MPQHKGYPDGMCTVRYIDHQGRPKVEPSHYFEGQEREGFTFDTDREGNPRYTSCLWPIYQDARRAAQLRGMSPVKARAAARKKIRASYFNKLGIVQEDKLLEVLSGKMVAQDKGKTLVAQPAKVVAQDVQKGVRVEYRKCGKANCKCARGELHGPYLYREYREGGRVRRQYLGKAGVNTIKTA